MKAIILVAGYATRLYPITMDTPKALIKLGGKTLLDLTVEKLEEITDIDEIILISNNKFYSNFMDWKDTYTGNKTITVLNDGSNCADDRLGAIGDTQFVIDKLNINDDIMLLVSDNYFTFSLKDYYDFFKSKNANCILVKVEEDREYLGKHFACVKVDNDGKVISLQEKPGGIPDTNLAAYAFYFYTKDSVKLIKTYLDEGNNKDAPGNFPAWLYSRQPIYTYRFDGECYDIGTLDMYNKLNEELSNK